MHSTVLVISKKEEAALNSVDYDVDDIYDAVHLKNSSCDEVAEWGGDPYPVINEFLTKWEEKGVIKRTGDQSFKFRKGGAKKFFADRYKELKEYVAKMTPEDFAKNSTSYHIRMLTEKKYGVYVYYSEYQQAAELDCFVRGGLVAYDANTEFVIETLFDYNE